MPAGFVFSLTAWISAQYYSITDHALHRRLIFIGGYDKLLSVKV